MTHNEEEYQSIKTYWEMKQVVELTEKDTKSVIITVFHIFKELGERVWTLRRDM